MRIYTRVGDKGETSLIGGRKVEKCDQRVETYGTVDEAISAISLARSCVKSEQVRGYLQKIEEDLFILNSELATLEPEKLEVRLTQEEVKWVEKKIDEITENIKLPRDSIL
ncbi:cobalamin adenosyltransferase, partial [Thermoanaerobacter ethanolicus JW 200]